MTGMEALRMSVAVSDAEHVTLIRIAGEGAFATVDRVCPRELFLREGQILHSLLLHDDARPMGDLYVCFKDDAFLLFAEGITGPELCEYLGANAVGTVEVTDLRPGHSLLSVDGPYAWEVLAEVFGPEVIGQPYMTGSQTGDVELFRVGKTGEYGYYLLLKSEAAAAVRTELLERGRDFGIAEATLADLDLCALENLFFNIRKEGLADISPFELQLQWRVSRRKEWRGAQALAERRARATHRIVQCASNSALTAGDEVVYGDRAIGHLMNAELSVARGDWLGLALIELPYSHPGLDAYEVRNQAGTMPIRTLAAPALDNRSLYVNPQIHSYRTRERDAFPPVAATPER